MKWRVNDTRLHNLLKLESEKQKFRTYKTHSSTNTNRFKVNKFFSPCDEQQKSILFQHSNNEFVIYYHGRRFSVNIGERTVGSGERKFPSGVQGQSP